VSRPSSGTLLDHSVGHSVGHPVGHSVGALAKAATVPVRLGLAVVAAGLTAAAAQFTTTVPFTAVPFTLTPVAVLLSGAVLGSRFGALSQVLYVLAGALGVAVFSPSVTLPPGPLRLLGPTGGYLMAYPLAAFVTGWLAEHGWDKRYLTSFAAMLVGLAVIYLGGVSWLAAMFLPSPGTAVAAGIAPFLVLDVLKVAAAAMILPQNWRLIGRHLA
jgi:biotin transport system substrate-specific component